MADGVPNQAKPVVGGRILHDFAKLGVRYRVVIMHCVVQRAALGHDLAARYSLLDSNPPSRVAAGAVVVGHMNANNALASRALAVDTSLQPKKFACTSQHLELRMLE